MSESIQAVILGAGGYVGGELIRLINTHPDFELAAAVSDSQAGKLIAETFPHLSFGLASQEFTARGDWLAQLEDDSKLALFSAAPHGTAANAIAAALAAAETKNLNVHVVDSSADFRYDQKAAWEQVYGGEHGAPELLSTFTCAVPEHLAVAPTPNIGHPGCFATATLLAAVPLMCSGLTAPEIFVSGITGSTGSGRSPQAGTHHPERNSNLYAYKPLSHRHSPEIARLASNASGRETTVHFVPHSGPFARGIHITVQAKAMQAVDEQQLRELYASAYADAPFVEVLSSSPKIKNVVASNLCHIGVATDGDAVVVTSAIDNLVKGAAGGAVQWMNRLWQLPETAGLTAVAPGWT